MHGHFEEYSFKSALLGLLIMTPEKFAIFLVYLKINPGKFTISIDPMGLSV